MHRIPSRFALRLSASLVVASLAGFVAAQVAADSITPNSGVVKNQKPSRTIKASKPVIESTNDVFPKIQKSINFGRLITPSNPRIGSNLQIEPNTLQVDGSILSSSRISSLGGGKFPAIDATGWVPPDPDLAVGPNHVVVVVNSSIAWYTKSGTPQFEQNMGIVQGNGLGFFESLHITPFVFDPKAFYDPISKRFFVVCLEQGEGTEKISKLLIAVSDDSDPNGTWAKYRIEAKQTVDSVDYWLDYPGWGYNKDAILCTGNMFGFEGGFNGAQYILIPKAALLTGAEPVVTYFSNQGAGSVQIMRGPEQIDRIYGVNVQNSSSMLLHTIENILTTPTLTTTSISVPSFFFPNQSAASTGGNALDSLDGRIMNVYYRAGRMLFTHGVRQSSGDSTLMSRWYDVNMNNWPVGTPTVRQTGNVKAGSGVNYFMPAISMNSRGEIGLVFTRSSTSITADFMATARKATDPAGTMGAPQVLAKSQSNVYGFGNNRWGDYFGLDVDPTDDRTFYGVGMVANQSSGWITRVESLRVTETVLSTPQSIAPFEGTNPTGTVANATTSDNTYYTLKSVKVARTGEVASARAIFQVPSRDVTEIKLGIEANAPAGSTCAVYLWDWNTNAYVYAGANPLTTTDAFKVVNAGGPFSRFISTDRFVRVLFRAISPTNQNRTAVPFVFKIDRINCETTF